MTHNLLNQRKSSIEPKSETEPNTKSKSKLRKAKRHKKRKPHKMSEYYFAKRCNLQRLRKAKDETIQLSVGFLKALPIFICIFINNFIEWDIVDISSIQEKKTTTTTANRKNVSYSVLNVWLLNGKTRVGCPLSQKEQQKVLSVYQQRNDFFCLQ